MKRAASCLARCRTLVVLVAAIVTLLMVCVAAFLAWRGLGLLASEDLEASDTAAGIQGLAAAVNLLATLLLVSVTTAYAFIAYKHLRLSGPDVSMGWCLAWVDPKVPWDGMAFNADIRSLRDGPTAEGRTEWYIAVELTNSGNQAVPIELVQLVVDGKLTCIYTGSNLSPPCPVPLGAHSQQVLYFHSGAVLGLLRESERLTTKEPHELQVVVNLGSGVALSSSKVPLQCFDLNHQ